MGDAIGGRGRNEAGLKPQVPSKQAKVEGGTKDSSCLAGVLKSNQDREVYVQGKEQDERQAQAEAAHRPVPSK